MGWHSAGLCWQLSDYSGQLGAVFGSDAMSVNRLARISHQDDESSLDV